LRCRRFQVHWARLPHRVPDQGSTRAVPRARVRQGRCAFSRGSGAPARCAIRLPPGR
jgi:hypothetical protein